MFLSYSLNNNFFSVGIFLNYFSSSYSQQMANAAYNLPAQGLGYAVPPFVPPPYWMQQMFAQQMAAGRIPQPNMYMPAN